MCGRIVLIFLLFLMTNAHSPMLISLSISLCLLSRERSIIAINVTEWINVWLLWSVCVSVQLGVVCMQMGVCTVGHSFSILPGGWPCPLVWIFSPSQSCMLSGNLLVERTISFSAQTRIYCSVYLWVECECYFLYNWE